MRKAEGKSCSALSSHTIPALNPQPHSKHPRISLFILAREGGREKQRKPILLAQRTGGLLLLPLCPFLEVLPVKHKTHRATVKTKETKGQGRWTLLGHCSTLSPPRTQSPRTRVPLVLIPFKFPGPNSAPHSSPAILDPLPPTPELFLLIQEASPQENWSS